MKSILVITGFVIIGLGLFLGWRLYPHLPARMLLPSCEGKEFFTALPVAYDDLLAVSPLGYVHVPNHTLPSDHMYFIVRQQSSPSSDSLRNFYAPGDIQINRLHYNALLNNGALENVDYAIDFSPCRQLKNNIDHLSTLAESLQEKAGPVETWKDCQDHVSRPGRVRRNCTKRIVYNAKAGELLGKVGGGLSVNFDWRTIDTRQTSLPFANPKRYSKDKLKKACAVDYFTPAIKEQLRSKWGRISGNSTEGRTIEPLCGAIAQDKPGTAQGNWFSLAMKGDADSPENWQHELALVHDFINPHKGVLAIGGGSLGQSMQLTFNPAHSGTINREPGTIQPGTTVYCYFAEIAADDPEANLSDGREDRRVLIQLVDPQTLKVEVQAGQCSETQTFKNPITYVR